MQQTRAVSVVALLAVVLPFTVVEGRDVLHLGDVLQVRGQTQQLPIRQPVDVSLAEGTDLEAVLWVHEEVAAQVVKHDGVLLRVVSVLPPNHTQRLYLKERRELMLHTPHQLTK